VADDESEGAGVMSQKAEANPPLPVNPLPRELAAGVYWLGECSPVFHAGTWLHTYNAAFLVVGSECAALVETGITSIQKAVVQQVAALLDKHKVDLRYIFVTHSEMAHCGNIGRFLHDYPEATGYGEISDMHLVFPESEGRMHFVEPGERFDLGGREIVVLESVFRDLIHSRWYFDTGAHVLFPGDGFAYSHVHDENECGHFAEEVPHLDIPTQMQRFATLAFHWTGFVDIEPYVDRLDSLFSEWGVELIAPTHGLPIRDVAKSMPIFRDGFRGMRRAAADDRAGDMYKSIDE
jgi:flavorubredoxin